MTVQNTPADRPRLPAVIAHCDWSMRARKRWMGVAVRHNEYWHIGPAEPVGASQDLLQRLSSRAREGGPLMVGFDFPIGLPRSYAKRTGFSSFREALLHFGEGDWSGWFDVAETPDEISVRRPFYPLRPGGTSRAHLTSGHCVEEAAALLRRCERSTSDRAAACSLFWTLGGSQVGKAAITGWQEILKPNLSQNDVCLWPFDGDLPKLIESCRRIIVETYPGEVYRHLGIPGQPAWSKRKKEGRRSAAVHLRQWMSDRPVVIAPQLHTAIGDGFGDSSLGEDQFDAIVGLFGMIDVATGVRPTDVPQDDAVRRWEGWILGQSNAAG